MNLTLSIDSYLRQCGSSQAKAPEKKDEKFHEYVIYNPKSDYRCNKALSLVWKGIDIINTISLFGLASVAVYFIFVPVPIHCLSMVLFSSIVCYTIYSSDLTNSEAYVSQTQTAQRILQKMDKIEPEDVQSKLKAMGLSIEDVHPVLLTNDNEKLRQLIAKYEFEMELIEQTQEMLEKNNDFDGSIEEQLKLKWEEVGYKTPFDSRYVKIVGNKYLLSPPKEKATIVDIDSLRQLGWKKLQLHRLYSESTKEQIALAKLNAAFILKVIQNPYEKNVNQYIRYSPPNEVLSAYRMVASKFNDKEADVIVTTIPNNDNNNYAKKYTAQSIASRTPVQLAREIFGLTTSSWLSW